MRRRFYISLALVALLALALLGLVLQTSRAMRQRIRPATVGRRPVPAA
ncbi:MAG TPA: hypothetical protein VEH52_14490 [Gaiellaceae bacterium]|jgi:hypothetical protein|nr:hypothetical protein [Gaiellaceae bacterium]